MKAITLWSLMAGVILCLSGCNSLQPAIVEEGKIHNPGIGWNGYSIAVPEGMDLLYPSDSSGKRTAEFYEFQTWYQMQQDPYGEDWYASFSERFVFGHEEPAYVIGFSCSTYMIHSSWSMLPSVRRQYLLRELISWKKVMINDMTAESQQIEINGHHGWHIRGSARPDFRKHADPVAYEGYFILGSLKEVYWVESFGDPDAREVMKNRVKAMVESLTF